MLGRIRSFFDQHIRETSEKPGQAGITDPVPVAVCALLLEMAHADGEFSADEMEEIVAVMEKDFGLLKEEAAEIVELAEEERRASIDLWQFSRLISDNCDQEEKLKILETLWTVIYVDGILDAHEDYLVHKLANVLDLSHRELMEVKLRVLGR